MAKDQKQQKNDDAGSANAPAESKDQKQQKNDDAAAGQGNDAQGPGSDPETPGNDPLPNDPPVKSADEIASELEDKELNEKRPLCEPSLRKGLKRLATYRVWRFDGTAELCCIEEVGPATTFTKALPL